MTTNPQHDGRRGRYLAAATIAVLAVIGAVLFGMGARGSSGPPQPDAAAQSATNPAGPDSSPNFRRPTNIQPTATKKAPPAKPLDFGPVLPESRPVALDIPSIGVHSGHLVPLGFTADGNLDVPSNPADPGWFSSGPTPGQFGPAVIAGHVDSTEGPAVFYRLGGLHQGDRIAVSRADGTVARFLVDRVQVFDKAKFPTHRVYANVTSRAELRLITCGGIYDDTLGYLSNVVVFAHLLPKGA